MKKIEIDYNTFYVIAVSLSLLSWGMLSIYTEMPVVMFFLVFIFSYILVRLCVRFAFDIKYWNRESTE
jgi:hypothetical protein